MSVCMFTVEMDHDGYRYWSAPLTEDAINAYIDSQESIECMLSDVDHTGAGCFGTCSDPLD